MTKLINLFVLLGFIVTMSSSAFALDTFYNNKVEYNNKIPYSAFFKPEKQEKIKIQKDGVQKVVDVNKKEVEVKQKGLDK